MFEQKNAGSSAPPRGTGAPPAGGSAPAKRFVYRCVENCTYDGLPYKQGETIELQERKESVPHFAFAGEA